MRRSLLFALVLGAQPAVALAQGDIARPRPVVMLGMDTSGSMERKVDNTAPRCLGGANDEANRYNIALAALTGSFVNFTCQDIDRSVAYSGDIDEDYEIHHYPIGALTTRRNDGVLDTYRERIKFGLMTFDSYAGLPDYNRGEQQSEDGLWSYGWDHTYHCDADLDRLFPDPDGIIDECIGWDYTWNAGVRRWHDRGNGQGTPLGYGRLVSVGRGTDDTADLNQINAEIQEELETLRPFHATPIAAMLDDMLYYFRNERDVQPADEPGGQDPYGECRKKFAVLFTDGMPNVDARPFCEQPGCTCPYLTAPQQARLLAQDGVVVFVIGFALESGSDAERDAVLRELWDIAVQGDSAEDCPNAILFDQGPAGCPAAVVNPSATPPIYHINPIIIDCEPTEPNDCRDAVAGAFSRIFDAIGQGSTSRSTPAFTSAGSTTSGGLSQDQFDAFFTISEGYPWEGHLDRSRWVCNGTDLEPEAFDPSTDSFGDILDNPATVRDLYTHIPAGADVAMLQSAITNYPGPNAKAVPFDTAIAPALMQASGPGERDEIVAFVHGSPAMCGNCARAQMRVGRRLGDIYHSAPVMLDPPQKRFGSPSYTGFQTDHATRLPVLFAGSNDGVLHAFNARAATADGIDAGSELWGFIAPVHVPVLRNQVQLAHNFYVDGGIAVADVLPYFRTSVTPTASEWRTVVVYGLRQGGAAYVALDVTSSLDPAHGEADPPRLLWQFMRPGLGLSYGAPQIAKVWVDFDGFVSERAVAILVGGQGELANGGRCDRALSYDSDEVQASEGVRCWEDLGRYVWIVDLMTGRVIREFGPGRPGDEDNPIDSPIIGTPAVYLSGFREVMRRAFVGDSDGTIWRIETESEDPSEWRMSVFHDLFYDDPGAQGHFPSPEMPAITTDPQERLVLLMGSGDPDNLHATGSYRVASVTEIVEATRTGVTESFTAEVNWELSLSAAGNGAGDNEKVTGALAVHEGIVYFATFVPADSGDNLCDFGRARLWGVDYLETRGDDAASGPKGRLAFNADGNEENGAETPAEGDNVDGEEGGRYQDLPVGSVLYGVQLVRRPTCIDSDEIPDPFGDQRRQITGIAPGDWQLIAHLPDTGGGAEGALPGAVAGGAGDDGVVLQLDRPTAIRRAIIDSWGALID